MKGMKGVAVVLGLVFVGALVLVSLGLAYYGGVRGLGLLGACFFVTFGVVVVLAQVIPAGMLLASLVGSVVTGMRGNERALEVR